MADESPLDRFKQALTGATRAIARDAEVELGFTADSGNRMQKKIKLAQDQKTPYMLVLGDREVEERTASPRTRTGEQLDAVGWEVLADRLAEQARTRRPD